MLEVVLLDIDGILTDGSVYVDGQGKESKRILFDDIDAIFELKRAGIKVGFLSGENNAFCEYVRDRFQADIFIAGCKDKLAAFKTLARDRNLDERDVCYVGDSKKDITLLQHLQCSFAPADADESVKRAAKTLLKSPRGRGVIAEVAGVVLRKQAPPPAAWDAQVDCCWDQRLGEHTEVIHALRADRRLLQRIQAVGDALVTALEAGNKILLCGNGGSASDCQHLAGEFVGRFLLERPALDAEALVGDTASLTAIGNDYAYELVFSRQVEAKGREGDVLVGISTSGASVNVLRALETARMKKMLTVAFTGGRVGTPIGSAAELCLSMPSTSTPRIQEAYMLVGHLLCEYVEARLFGTPATERA